MAVLLSIGAGEARGGAGQGAGRAKPEKALIGELIDEVMAQQDHGEEEEEEEEEEEA